MSEVKKNEQIENNFSLFCASFWKTQNFIMEFTTGAYLQWATTNSFPDRKLRSFYEQVVHRDRLWIRIEKASRNVDFLRS